MQKLWTQNLHWDDPVPEKIDADFQMWAAELKQIETIILPRRYWRSDRRANTVLHMCCDASAYAYGFCAYLVSEAGEERESSMVLAKSRIAPLKNATIPRLELMALTLAAEATTYIRSQCEFRIDEEHILTDNSGVYFQATSENPERLPTFARNPAQKIRAQVQAASIHHIPGILNPSDFVSRGCNVREIMESDWLAGPKFITGPRESWPNFNGKVSREVQANRVSVKNWRYESFAVVREAPRTEIFVYFNCRHPSNLGKYFYVLTHGADGPFICVQSFDFGEQ